MQKLKLSTSLTPELIYLYDMDNVVTVVIDVLRATSTIAALLHMGASKVIPVNSIEECIAVGKKLGCITAGERDGAIVPGLQKGNSPLQFSAEEVANKSVALTTTNGTMLLNELLLSGAETIITGAFVNISAVCSYILSQKKNILLACAGWKGMVNVEDALFAGAVVHRIKSHFEVCDSSIITFQMYRNALTYSSLIDFMQTENASHFRRLSYYKHEDDIARCFEEDYHACLPFFRNGALVRLD